MRQWAEDDLPDHKMLLKGVNSLSNAELLAIIIGTGIKDNSSLDIAQQMLRKSDDNLSAFWRMNYSDLKKITGIGQKRAIKLLAIFALARRRNESAALSQQKISNSRDAFNIFHSLIGDLPYEEFWMLILNKANKIIKKIRISEGGVSGTVVDPKKVFHIALESLASSLILIHNHPSGNLAPSEADNKLTKKLSEGANLLDITILDHLIIADHQFFSYADNGQL